jgi:hypothetical protein
MASEEVEASHEDLSHNVGTIQNIPLPLRIDGVPPSIFFLPLPSF